MVWFGFILAYLNHKTVKTKITNKRIIFTKGLFTKEVEEIELYRIVDISLKQSLMGRILNFGIIKIVSNDKTAPFFEVLLENPEDWKEQIYSLTSKTKKDMGLTIREEL